MQKKYIAGIILLPLIGYFAYGKIFSPSSNTGSLEETYNIVEVEKKDFSSSISLSGNTKIKNEQKLRFNTAGKIVDVYVLAGEEVKQGQPLASIDSTQALGEIEKAKLSLESSKVKLQDFTENLNNSGIKNNALDIEIKQSQISQKQVELDYIDIKHSNTLASKEIDLKQSANNHKILTQEVKKNIGTQSLTDAQKEKIIEDKKLELSKLESAYSQFTENYDDLLTQKINVYLTKLENQYYTLQSNLSDFESTLGKTNDILGIDDTDFKYESFFSAQDVSHKQEAKNAYKSALNQLKEAEKSFQTITGKTDQENILKNLIIQQTLSQTIYDMSDAMVGGFENSIETSGFSQGEIDSYSSQFSGYRSSSQSRITQITSSIDELKTYDSIEKIRLDHGNEGESQKNAIKNLELEIQNISLNQDFLVNTVDYNIQGEKLKEQQSLTSLEDKIYEIGKLKKLQVEEKKQLVSELEKLKLELKDLEKKRGDLINLSDNQDYIFALNDVKQNELSLRDAYKRLEDYSLEAPFDGIVTKVEIAKGDRLNADTEKYISIVDPDTIEVKSFVSQSDIVKISSGMKTQMKVDAYSEESFSGSISEIETTPVEQNGISKFQIKVLLENPKSLKLYSGMKVDIKIPTKDLGEVIVIPFTAVSVDSETGEKFVSKLGPSGEKQKQVVELGYTDGEYYEVLSGLELGDKIYEIDFNPDLFKSNNPFGDGEEEFEEF